MDKCAKLFWEIFLCRKFAWWQIFFSKVISEKHHFILFFSSANGWSMKKCCFVVKCLCILVLIRCIYCRASQSLAMLYARGSPRGVHSMTLFPILFNSRTMFTWSISWSWCSTEYMLRNAVLEMHEQLDFRLFSRTFHQKPLKSGPRKIFPPLYLLF